MTTVGTGARSAARAASCPADELPQLADALLADLVDTVPGALSATVVTVTAGPRVRPWARSGPVGADLDGVQAWAGAGPVVDAAGQEAVVVSGDVWADDRWQLIAVGEAASVRSVLGVQLTGPVDERPVLAVHGVDDRLTDPRVVQQVALAVPELSAAVAVLRARQEAVNLQRALESNRVIGAAIGVTMATHQLTYDAAGDLLRSLSNHVNLRLADLAADILFTGELPAVDERRRPRRRPVPRP